MQSADPYVAQNDQSCQDKVLADLRTGELHLSRRAAVPIMRHIGIHE